MARAHRLAWLLAFSACSVWAASAPTPDDPFPEPPALAPNVDFWCRVFGEWDVGQVVIHDVEYPAIVYEIVELEGPTDGGYTPKQRARIDGLCAYWQGYLRGLEHKIESGALLDDADKQWALYFATQVGADKLAGAHERVRSQRGLRERFRRGFERSFRFEREMREILRGHGVPEDLAYLPHVESSFQVEARSSAGAVGIWQFTRGAGKRYLQITSAVDERLDPIAATDGAARYLRDAHDELGSWPLAVTSYNHGVAGMQKAKARFGTDFERIFREYDGKLFGFASKNFYAEFLAVRRIAREPESWFPEGYAPEAEPGYDSVRLEVRASPQWIASRYGVPLAELAPLNLAWSRRAIQGGAKLPPGLRVWLPPGTLDARAAPAPSPAAAAPPAREAEPAPAGSGQHVVRRGDTLARIAQRYRVALPDLLTANTLTLRSIIIPGQILRIPH